MATGKQQSLISPLEEFSFGSGTPQSEIDILHDTGSRLRPKNLGSWISVTEYGNTTSYSFDFS